MGRTGGKATVTGFEEIVRSDPAVWEIRTAGDGPRWRLPLTAEMLLESPSGDIFGLTQNAGMGWDPRELGRPQYLMLSTQGGIRAPDGSYQLQYLRPLLVQRACLACHGDPATFSPEVRAVLARRYPQDRATGYAVGDLRGAVSVRVPLPSVSR